MTDIATNVDNVMNAQSFFAENGYYHAKKVFDGESLGKLTRDFDQIVAQLNRTGEDIDATWPGKAVSALSGSNDVILHTHNVHKYSTQWLDAFKSSVFLKYATGFIGEDIVLHHSKLFQKPPLVGSPFPIHQDWAYFPTKRDTMIAGIIHLQDTTDEMGCLRVYPGSHKLGRIADSDGRQACEALEQYPLDKAVPLEAEAGDVLFFHYFTLHGSMPNRSKKTRKTVLCQLHSGNDFVEEEKGGPNEQLILQGWNHQLCRGTAGRI